MLSQTLYGHGPLRLNTDHPLAGVCEGAWVASHGYDPIDLSRTGVKGRASAVGTPGYTREAWTFDGSTSAWKLSQTTGDYNIGSSPRELTVAVWTINDGTTTSYIPVATRSSSSAQGYDMVAAPGSVANAYQFRAYGGTSGAVASGNVTGVPLGPVLILGRVRSDAKLECVYAQGGQVSAASSVAVSGAVNNTQALHLALRGSNYYAVPVLALFVFGTCLTDAECVALADTRTNPLVVPA